MKKLILLVLTSLLMISFSACTNPVTAYHTGDFATEPFESEITEEMFSKLTTMDIPKLENESNVIAIFKEEITSPKEIVEFLIKSDFILTYWHVGANIALVDEEDSDTSYTANFAAEHEYCTNECVTKEYSFSVTINKENGEITVSNP
jgi:hypothetical protein